MLPRLTALLLLSLGILAADIKRIVILKLDGVPASFVDRYVAETDPRTGKSKLPWMRHLFYENGARLANFYVRGLSLSAPAWAILDTGRHSIIKGNVEYDRYTMRTYDHLQFFDYYFNYALSRRVDMPAVEVLEENRAALFSDFFPGRERHQSPQLLQRRVKWTTLPNALKRRFTGRNPRELLGEWHVGFGMGQVWDEQVERELIARLRDPGVRYLDYYLPEFDHMAHLTHDPHAQLEALRRADAVVGRLWSAIQISPHRDETALVVVSDHGTNTDPKVYSQGYNLVEWLGSEAGGAHHVVTNRHPLTEYKLKGLNPFINAVTTPSKESLYLKGQSDEYPTALIDPDGNERAAIYLRDSDLNLLHVLLRELKDGRLSPEVQKAAEAAVRDTIKKRKSGWQTMLDELRAELWALLRAIEREQVSLGPEKKWSEEERVSGVARQWRRRQIRIEDWKAFHREYSRYAQTVANLLSLAEDSPGRRFNIGEVLPPRSVGDRNNIYRLQNYVIGPAAGGLQLRPDGTLDMDRSFRRIDYFEQLARLTVRNNLQRHLSSRPVDFVARRLERTGARDAIWVTSGPDRQLVIQARQAQGGELELKCVPAAGLRQDAAGRIELREIAWKPGLPLGLFEDPELKIESEDRAQWLSEWHTELEWLRAVHRTKYSNAIIGLHEQLALHESAPEGASLDDTALLERFRIRRRALVEPDLLVLANDHWNFNVRGFNPGGNHGSFFRISTHSVLMLAGGRTSGVPRGLVIEEPYDALSLAPTLAKLMGIEPSTPYPGRVITELIPQNSPAIQSEQ